MLICCHLCLFPPELKEMRLIRNSQFYVTLCLWLAPLGNSKVIGKDEDNHDVTSEESACAVWLNIPSTIKDMTGTSWESLQFHTCTWFFTNPNRQNNANHLSLIITSIKDCIYTHSLSPLVSFEYDPHALFALIFFTYKPKQVLLCGVCYIIAFYWPSLSSASLCIVPDWNKAFHGNLLYIVLFIAWYSERSILHYFLSTSYLTWMATLYFAS